MMTQKIVIDPGHGGKDPGAIAVNGSREADINLDISLALGDFLQNKGIDIQYTRTKDVAVSLLKRAVFVENVNPSALISIHCNAAIDDPKTETDERKFISGFEIFVRDEGDRRLAEHVHKYLFKAGLKNRGIKQDVESLGKKLLILSNSVPAVLVELGFLTNEADNEFIKANKMQIAELLSKGILDFFGMVA